MFRRVQVRPFDMMKSKFRFYDLEGVRTNVNIERAVEVAAEVQSA